MATKDDPTPQIPKDDKSITLRDVLIHIQHHATRLDNRIDRVVEELSNFHKEFRGFAKDVDDLDFRVQDLEDANIPGRVEALEKYTELVKA